MRGLAGPPRPEGPVAEPLPVDHGRALLVDDGADAPIKKLFGNEAPLVVASTDRGKLDLGPLVGRQNGELDLLEGGPRGRAAEIHGLKGPQRSGGGSPGAM